MGASGRKRLWGLLAAGAALLAVLLFIPLPYPPNLADRSAAVSQALTALLDDKPVPTPRGLEPLKESYLVRRAKGQAYFINEVGVPDTIFTSCNLKAISKNARPDFEKGDVIIRFSFKDDVGQPSWYMQFSYLYGNEGGEGYEIRMFKSPWTRRFSFVFEWIA